MKIVIAGGSGFIGKKLTEHLLEKGHEIIILTRKPKQTERRITYVSWLINGASPENEIQGVDAFINLAGVSINAGRWTEKHQQQIYESRMTATDELIRIITALSKKPTVFINASAIGIYPASLHDVYTEASMEIGSDFLAKTVHDWERKAENVKVFGIRPIYMRFGVVLGIEGGALPLMALPYKMFAGGTVGTGEQWVSWVHVTDVVRAIEFVLENHSITGPVNVTAPTPVEMRDFGRTIGTVTRRPHWLHVPAFAMELTLGKKSALVLEGQNVLPTVLLNEGFQFMFPSLKAALEDLLINTKKHIR